jgi:hypothetical protein
MAASTPASRNRAVDLYRVVALLFVVLGHWLAAAVWIEPDGALRFNTILAIADWTHWITWVVQVMPVFFIVGGYANWLSFSSTHRKGADLWTWLTMRFRRLTTPVVPLVAVVTMLIVATLALGVDARIVRSGSWNALVPLWFLAVYIIVIAAMPGIVWVWQRWGWRSVAAGCCGALVIDTVRFSSNIESIGWINFIAVWFTAHQVGFGWASEAHRPRSETLVVVMLAAPLLLVAATAYGPYPVSMVAVPGAPENNTLPPTAAMLVITAFQYAVMRLAEPAVSRWVARPAPWTAVVGASSVMMTVYLWHLTAVALVVLAGHGIGWGFDLEPATAAWFVTRPIWIAILATVLAILIALFGWAEHAARSTTTPHPLLVGSGAAAIVGAIAIFVTDGVVTRDGDILWEVLLLYVAGTVAVGAWPQLRRPS